MKKLKWALVLGLCMAITFTSLALAEQKVITDPDTGQITGYDKTPQEFDKTGATKQYPNGIYLPNAARPDTVATDKTMGRIHSQYNANTDACASCHATHTAAGAALLQWGSVFDTCMACHDGTITTTYNVSKGEFVPVDTGAGSHVTSAGKFGDFQEGQDTDGHSDLSVHSVNSYTGIWAAPGGKRLGGKNKDNGDWKGSWTNQFGCESCHSPHGRGGNARLLTPDPNGVAALNKKVDFKLTHDAAAGGFVAVDDYNKLYMLTGYPYNKQLAFKVNGSSVAVKDVKIDNSKGYSVVTYAGINSSDTVLASFVPSLQIKMNITGYLQTTENVQHIAGLNNFCGACHTDYNTNNVQASGRNQSGYYTQAYRHKVGMDWNWNDAINVDALKFEKASVGANNAKLVTCETCHVAHGTDSDWWTRYEDSLTTDPNKTKYGVDEFSGRSALKRLPNMATCEVCHQKGADSEGYTYLAGALASDAIDSQVGAAFAGSNTCLKCHPKVNYQANEWDMTLHSKMLQKVTPSTYDDIIPAEIIAAWPADMKLNVTGTFVSPQDIDFVVGNENKMRFAVQVGTDTNPEIRFAEKEYYFAKVTAAGTTAAKWNGYTGKNFEYEDFCMGCHSTGMAIDNSGQFSGDINKLELGVGCEACHGPGSNHVKHPSVYNIVNPSKLDNVNSSAICGQCHNRGWNKTYTGGTLNAEQSHLGLTADATKKQREDVPNFWDFVGTANDAKASLDAKIALFVPDNFTQVSPGGIFWPSNVDGVADSKKHHQQYQDFVQSKHYEQDLMNCATCHSSHDNGYGDGVLKLGLEVDGEKGYVQGDSQYSGAKQWAEFSPAHVGSYKVCTQCHDTAMTDAELDQYMPLRGNSANKYFGQNGDLRAHTFATSHPTN